MAICYKNCTSSGQARIQQAIGFITKSDTPLVLDYLAIEIVQSDNFEQECEQLAAYFPPLGLESLQSRLVFNPTKGGTHTVLINQAAISGLAAVHAVVTQLIHLANLLQYSVDHGNVYRYDQERSVASYYYEFLLWSKFQAMKIATRCHALTNWHAINGDAPPADGCYRFTQGPIPIDGVRAALHHLAGTSDTAAWRNGLWDLLEELSYYFGMLAFYQPHNLGKRIDEGLIGNQLVEVVGSGPCNEFAAALDRAGNYDGFLREKQRIREAVLIMQEAGKARFIIED